MRVGIVSRATAEVVVECVGQDVVEQLAADAAEADQSDGAIVITLATRLNPRGGTAGRQKHAENRGSDETERHVGPACEVRRTDA